MVTSKPSPQNATGQLAVNDPNKKAQLLMAVSQLDMLILAFGDAPPDVKENAKKFRDSLEVWANQ